MLDCQSDALTCSWENFENFDAKEQLPKVVGQGFLSFYNHLDVIGVWIRGVS
jgi:hypothetical protein